MEQSTQQQLTTSQDFILTLDSVDLRNIQSVVLPLDGEEVLKAVLAHIEKKLRNDGQLLAHLSYEEVIWKFMIQVQWAGYSAKSSQALSQAQGAIRVVDENKHDSNDPTIEPSTGKISVIGSQLDPTIAPDEVREKTSQPIPVLATKGQGAGNIVRVPAWKLQRGK